jgi:hypothetical protein
LIWIDFAKSREESMGELKSALERAMEKTGKLGSLSAEEMKKREDEKFFPAGRVVAEKYLTHGHTKVLKDDIEAVPAGERDMMRKAVRVGLAKALNFDASFTAETIDRALAGLLALASGNQGVIEELIAKVKGIFDELEQEMDRVYAAEFKRIDDEERARLQKMGIVGSAICEINIEGGVVWKQIASGLRLRYNAKLEPLKRELAEVVVKS